MVEIISHQPAMFIKGSIPTCFIADPMLCATRWMSEANWFIK